MSQHSKDIELKGVPTVAIAGANMVNYARTYDFKYVNGMPIRYVAVPFPVAGQPRSVHEQYVAGKDQVSGKPLMQAIVDALTQPLTDNELFAGKAPEAKPEPRFLAPASAAQLQRLFKDREWTDYNPIVLPTKERVAAMLKGTHHKPDEVVKVVHPVSISRGGGGARPITVEKAAVYAVMAGAKPSYFPLILALATQAPFGNSTSSMANTIIVNGPIRAEIGMNAGTNAMGPYNEANSIIGRAYMIMSKVAGDLRNNVSAVESLGNNLQYNSMTIAENEELLPEGWQPLHVQMGFKPTDSVVSVGVGWSYISSLGEVQSLYPANMLIRDYMRSLSAFGSGATIFVDPTVAKLLKNNQGYRTKEQFSQWLSQNVEKTVASYWGNGVITTSNTALAQQGLEPYAGWLKAPRDQLIKPFINPRAINIVVVGGNIQTTWFVTDFMVRKGVLVDDWR